MIRMDRSRNLIVIYYFRIDASLNLLDLIILIISDALEDAYMFS
jgi:hypothetical protein